MSAPRVYVDFDDVLCETAREFTRVLAAQFGKRVAFEEIVSFDLGRSFGLPPEGLARLMRAVHEPAVLRRMAPVPGALEALGRWAAAGLEIWVVTGRPLHTRAASLQWLEEHRVPFAALEFVDKYAREPPGAPGAAPRPLAELAALDFALAVEDAPQMVRFLAERTRAPVAVLRRPWNAALGLAPPAAARVVRCADWPDLLRRFPRPGAADDGRKENRTC